MGHRRIGHHASNVVPHTLAHARPPMYDTVSGLGMCTLMLYCVCVAAERGCGSTHRRKIILSTNDECRLLTTKEVSDQTGLTTGHLSNLRHRGRGPEFIRLGGAVRYRQATIDAWVTASTVSTKAA